jgi:hypothetical protein
MNQGEQYFYTVEVKELQLQCYPPTAFEFDDMFIEVYCFKKNIYRGIRTNI